MAWQTYDTINTEQANGNILRTYFQLIQVRKSQLFRQFS